MAPAISKPLLSDLVAQIGKVPLSHIRPVGDRPDLANVDNESGAGIPLIDLKSLNGPERPKVVEAIGRACESDGLFMRTWTGDEPRHPGGGRGQVTNHGIPAAVVEGMLRVAREFFHLPESERLKCYSDDPKKAIRLSTSFNVRTEKVSNWRDLLRLHCYPLECFVDQWPSNHWCIISRSFFSGT
ncbi:protein DMR6-LIKE OXYGENASE 1-like isoform X2 [Miscanthus floridulus]|uniref:protein DMR6-LIKE OXYGENASE 1-like isoform X2 n=1 Tax=Miscanthus floridulus TaxID=154761 RepID=UPI003459071A